MAIDAKTASNGLYTSYHLKCRPEIQSLTAPPISKTLRLDMNLIDEIELEGDRATTREELILKYHLLVDWLPERTPLEFLVEGPLFLNSEEGGLHSGLDRGFLEACDAALRNGETDFTIGRYAFRSKPPVDSASLAISGTCA